MNQTCRLVLVFLHALLPALVAQTTMAEPVPCAEGWRASRIHQADAGIWYAHIDQFLPQLGQPEVICCDDKGRLQVLTVYSAQWTQNAVVPDGLWLAPSRPADVDPRVAGRELYAAGRAGSVHQVTVRDQPFSRFSLESREIGHRGGEEFHAILAADLVAGGADELLVFGITGAVYQLRAEAVGEGFVMSRVAELPGRVRDVGVLQPARPGQPATMLGASRSGHLLRMRLGEQGLEHEVVLHEDCGLGRIAIGRQPGVAYATRDDGVLLRIAFGADGKAVREVIYAGGQGLRGVAAGRFFADGREAVAVYGYDRRVHLISRGADGGFGVQTLYHGEQKGHWLTVGELDGRNDTDELLATGFDGTVVLLARPAGEGLPAAAVPEEEREPPAPAAAPGDARTDADAVPALRLGVRLSADGAARLTPFSYRGGFEQKALLYETLVQRDAAGRIAPGLAASWRRDPDGRAFVFTLRAGARWHDDTPVTAADVAMHFRRWVGLPEHDWLSSSRRITAVRALGERELRVELEQPCALLADLCAINPTAVVAPGARTREGVFERPLGSGPFAFVEVRDGGRALLYRRVDNGALLELRDVGTEPLAALRNGEVDAVVGSWLLPLEAPQVTAMRRDDRFVVVEAPGSSTWHLSMRWSDGALADLACRRRVAAAIDREELVRVAFAGLADAATGYAAPSIADWPAAAAIGPITSGSWPALALAAEGAPPLLIETLLGQLRRAGLMVKATADRATADLVLAASHGVPYDPFTVVTRFGPAPERDNAATPDRAPRDTQLAMLVAALAAEADEGQWPRHYAKIQARLDELLPLVSLVTSRRLAVARRGVSLPPLDHDLYRLPAALLAVVPEQERAPTSAR